MIPKPLNKNTDFSKLLKACPGVQCYYCGKDFVIETEDFTYRYRIGFDIQIIIKEVGEQMEIELAARKLARKKYEVRCEISDRIENGETKKAIFEDLKHLPFVTMYFVSKIKKGNN